MKESLNFAPCTYSGQMTLNLINFAGDTSFSGTFEDAQSLLSGDPMLCESSMSGGAEVENGTIVKGGPLNPSDPQSEPTQITFTVTSPTGDVCGFTADPSSNMRGNFTCQPSGATGTFSNLDNNGGVLPQGSAAFSNYILHLYSATVVTDGHVVIVGDTDGGVGTIELYNPRAHKLTTSRAALMRARNGHTAALLTTGPQAGKILIAGGFDRRAGTVLSSTELYDPVADAVTCIDGSQESATSPTCPPSTNMIDSRVGHTATVLNDGKVLLAGGLSMPSGSRGLQSLTNLSTAELYDPVNGVFTCVDGSAPGGTPPACPSSANLNQQRAGQTATLLQNGQVLLAGGLDLNLASGRGETIDSAEVFDPSSARFIPVSTKMRSNRVGHSATLLANGKVLLAGGISGKVGRMGGSFRSLNSTEVYDPYKDTFTATGNLHSARALQTAVLRSDGKVTVVGGLNWSVSLASGRAVHTRLTGKTVDSIEVFDPQTGGVGGGGEMSLPRSDHALVALPAE